MDKIVVHKMTHGAVGSMKWEDGAHHFQNEVKGDANVLWGQGFSVPEF